VCSVGSQGQLIGGQISTPPSYSNGPVDSSLAGPPSMASTSVRVMPAWIRSAFCLVMSDPGITIKGVSMQIAVHIINDKRIILRTLIRGSRELAFFAAVGAISIYGDPAAGHDGSFTLRAAHSEARVSCPICHM
jgi:hypothetical protein